MITYSRLGYNGRLGNQLFQFASTIGIARKLGFDVMFPANNLNTGVLQRRNDGQEFIANIEFTKCFEISDSFFSDNISVKYIAREGTFHFDSNLLNIPDQTDIFGYLQSEKYFEHCSYEIKDILKIQPHILNIAKDLISETAKKNITGIHVRRGDFMTSGNIHPFIGCDYIKKSIAEFNHDDTHFIVVSDDCKWCEENLNYMDNLTIINSKCMLTDFAVLTLCDNLIMSNSSFSWWAGYLNKNQNKKIIAPKNWFGGTFANLNTDDIYRKGMVLI